MMENCASIDIGTFTARLLIARKPEAQERLRPLARRRAYIRLGEGFSRSYGGKTIQPEAIDRTLIVLKDFLQYTKLFDVHEVRAVATGVVRDATLHKKVIEQLSAFFQTKGFTSGGVLPSPILGPKGNREFFILLDLT